MFAGRGCSCSPGGRATYKSLLQRQRKLWGEKGGGKQVADQILLSSSCLKAKQAWAAQGEMDLSFSFSPHLRAPLWESETKALRIGIAFAGTGGRGTAGAQ